MRGRKLAQNLGQHFRFLGSFHLGAVDVHRAEVKDAVGVRQHKLLPPCDRGRAIDVSPRPAVRENPTRDRCEWQRSDGSRVDRRRQFRWRRLCSPLAVPRPRTAAEEAADVVEHRRGAYICIRGRSSHCTSPRSRSYGESTQGPEMAQLNDSGVWTALGWRRPCTPRRPGSASWAPSALGTGGEVI